MQLRSHARQHYRVLDLEELRQRGCQRHSLKAERLTTLSQNCGLTETAGEITRDGTART